jgi:hypothetical protein
MTPVTDPTLLAQLNAPGSGLKPVTDPALLQQLNAPDPGVLAAAGRGAANNFPLAPQAIAGLSQGDYSQNLTDWNAKAQAAKAAHPYAYGTGAVAGAVAPLAIPGVGEALEAAPVLGNAALGAANAISNTDLTKDPSKIAKEAAIGGVVGGAVGKGAQLLGGAMEGTATKLASYATSPEAVAARLENPAAFQAAPDVEHLPKTLPGIADKFDHAISGLSDAAHEKLSTSSFLQPTANDAGGAFTKDQIIGTVDSARKSLGGAFGSDTQSAARALDNLGESLLAKRSTVSQNQVHDLIKQLDEEIPWDKVWRTPENLSATDHSLIEVRTKLDALLKEQNPEYAAAMKPVSEEIQARTDFIKKFGLQRVKGQGYLPTDSTAGKLGNSLQDYKIDSDRVLGNTQEAIGADLKTPLLAQQFKGPTPESPMGIGSRLGAVAGGAMGGKGLGLAGAGFGAVVGQRILRAPASEFGRGLAGRALDAIGNGSFGVPQNVTGAVNDYVSSKFTREPEPDASASLSSNGIMDHVMSNPAMSSFRPTFQAAAQRGPQAVIANHFTLMQRDPEYNKTFTQTLEHGHTFAPPR